MKKTLSQMLEGATAYEESILERIIRDAMKDNLVTKNPASMSGVKQRKVSRISLYLHAREDAQESKYRCQKRERGHRLSRKDDPQ